MNDFEKAAITKLRFPFGIGVITTEQLFDLLPADLEKLARNVSSLAVEGDETDLKLRIIERVSERIEKQYETDAWNDRVQDIARNG